MQRRLCRRDLIAICRYLMGACREDEGGFSFKMHSGRKTGNEDELEHRNF